tara:strand:+ start:360 stop:788 length:429 start_codon:yes stop_codon:yes gene_type:complete
MIKQESRYKIDFDKKVYVYRNLHKGCWSVKQNGLVKAHSLEMEMFSCIMKISQAGWLRVIREKRKNVHAFVHGYIHPNFIGLDFEPEPIDGDRKVWTDLPEDQMREIRYNPYDRASFTYRDDGSPAWFASYARFDEKRLLIA